jgi:tetratricopeptide (TPR) repeat protein
MKRFILPLLLLSAPALAEDDDGSEDVVAPQGDSVTGRKPPPLRGTLREDGTILPSSQEEMIGQYPARIVNGAKMLNMDVEFVWECWSAMEGLYERDYAKSKRTFAGIEERWRGSGVGPVGQALVWQALMLENFDFKYDAQYNASFSRAQQAMEQAMLSPGNEVWETFLLGALLGVDAIHKMRKEEFVTAINRGMEAMKYVSRAGEMAPEFVDAQLGDGLWLYWRSVVALNTPGVPAFSDERERGIEMMQLAQQRSVFLRPAAGHALTYTWIEEGQMNRALGLATSLSRAYPNNIVNLQVLGRIQMYRRLYPESETTFKRIISIDANNERVHYYLQRLYLRWGKLDESLAHADKYLAFNLSDYQRSYALYYKGTVYEKQGRLDEAEAAYKEAWRVDKLKRAKAKLERIEERRAKAGN